LYSTGLPAKAVTTSAGGVARDWPETSAPLNRHTATIPTAVLNAAIKRLIITVASQNEARAAARVWRFYLPGVCARSLGTERGRREPGARPRARAARPAFLESGPREIAWRIRSRVVPRSWRTAP